MLVGSEAIDAEVHRTPDSNRQKHVLAFLSLQNERVSVTRTEEVRINTSLNEIRDRGYAALLRELGPTGYVRFIQRFDPGSGDYTAERHAWLDRQSADDVMKLIKEHRSRTTRTRTRGGPTRKKGQSKKSNQG